MTPPGSICSVQNQVVEILQNVEPSSQAIVQETIDNIESTIRKNILETLHSSVDPVMLRQFKLMNPNAYEEILATFGFFEKNPDEIEIDSTAKAITDFCSLQNRLMGLVVTLAPEQQAVLLRIIGQLTMALKPKIPKIVTVLLIENRGNLQAIFQANPKVASQFEKLINQYAANSLMSSFGK